MNDMVNADLRQKIISLKEYDEEENEIFYITLDLCIDEGNNDVQLWERYRPNHKAKIILHLDFRYIEGLTSDKATMCDWNKQLNSSKENTRTDEAKLPAHWLADNGEHATSLDALWALRDFLVQDSLGVVKVLNHASL